MGHVEPTPYCTKVELKRDALFNFRPCQSRLPVALSVLKELK
jgi:hypothetical protein